MSVWFSCVCVEDTIIDDDPPLYHHAYNARDKFVIFTGPHGSPEDNEEVDHALNNFGMHNRKGHRIEHDWQWPEGFIPRDDFLTDPRKVSMIETFQHAIDDDDIDYHALAAQSDFPLDKKTLIRYLEAYQWADAPPGRGYADRLKDTIQWRANFPLPVTNYNLLRTELATGKNFTHGKSRDGRPIIYIFVARENTWHADNNVTTLVYTLERAIASMDMNTLETIVIIDCKDITLSNAPSTTFLSLVVDIMGRHLPRRNGQIFVCNVSSMFYFIWNVISAPLSEVAKSKVRILTSDQDLIRNEIGKCVDLDELLPEFGGNSKYQFDVDMYLQSDPRLCNSSSDVE